MSTRGYMGIKKKGKLKGQYNHFDSYFDGGLGENIVKVINKFKKQNNLLEVLNNAFDNIELVDEDTKPTKKQQDYCLERGLFDESVSTQSLEDWYCLLRETQGNLELYLNQECKYMLDGNSFLENNLFCDYAYIINLDTNKLDIYENGNDCLLGSYNLLSLNASNIKKKIEKYYKD